MWKNLVKPMTEGTGLKVITGPPIARTKLKLSVGINVELALSAAARLIDRLGIRDLLALGLPELRIALLNVLQLFLCKLKSKRQIAHLEVVPKILAKPPCDTRTQGIRKALDG